MKVTHAVINKFISSRLRVIHQIIPQSENGIHGKVIQVHTYASPLKHNSNHSYSNNQSANVPEN